MSITLNNSDFQCLQDQLVDLKTKNYELAEKNRRGQADFEAAKAKICTLQLKLEEQERDFQVTSTTLRREIEVAYNSKNANKTNDEDSVQGKADKDGGDSNTEEDYKVKYKKLLHKAKELQQRYEKSVEVVQQMDTRVKVLTAKTHRLEEENLRLKEELEDKQNQLDSRKNDDKNPDSTIPSNEETDEQNPSNCPDSQDGLSAITKERDNLRAEVDRLSARVQKFDSILESQAEERKIQERKGLQMVKELKRQLASEKSHSETLQNRLETLLKEPPTSTSAITISNADFDTECQLSASSSTNGNGSGSNGVNRANNNDANSVSSWSLVPGRTKLSNQALNESISICSIDSEDRETVQQPKCDTKSESLSTQPNSSSSASVSRHDLSGSPSINSPVKMFHQQQHSNTPSQVSNSSRRLSSSMCLNDNSNENATCQGMSIEEQAALIERLTNLQHEKWGLEEKLSYLEQANSVLTEDLTNKSEIIRTYFMDQATKTAFNGGANHHDNMGSHGLNYSGTHPTSSRRTSLSSNVNQLLSEKPSLKKVVDFLKERSQVSTVDSENITREATKKMQLMLEETLIKCLKLQENLDSVTLQLNKLER